MGTTMKTTASRKIYDRPSTSANVLESIIKGAHVTVISKTAGTTSESKGKAIWYEVTTARFKGYLIYKLGDTTYLKNVVAAKDSTSEVKDEQSSTTQSSTLYSSDYVSSTFSADYMVDDVNIDNLIIDNIVGIHGMPYQFLPITDLRLDSNASKTKSNDGIGAIYADKIVSKMPLVLFTPGRPVFLEGYTKEEKEGALERLINYGNAGNYSASINSILSKPGRYYTFQFDYSRYYDYVESMLWSCAKFLDVHNERVTIGGVSGKLGNFKWRNANNSKLSNYMVSKEYIPFYVDSQDSVSENFNNDTSQSALASSLETLETIAKEVMFITGNYTGHAVGIENMDEYLTARDRLDDLLSKSIFKSSKLINSIADTATTIAAGGKIYFPEIWSDSSFTKSYDVSMKFRTPDGDVLSWYINILVPLIHCICMAAPQELSNPNMYNSPFLIRAFYKGIFNIDMGIITSLNINKGKSSSWTIDGLPTEVDISMDIKDLYSVFSISNALNDKDKLAASTFVKNIGLIDYLASTCGLNINKPELTRSIDLYLLLKKNSITNYPNRLWSRMSQSIDNTIRKIYEGTILSK